MSEQMKNDMMARREAISALADGDGTSADAAVQHWVEDPAAREAWHTYHLIGDALRSDDLAVPRAHDEAFLKVLRARLAQEPTVLAPSPRLVAPVRRARRWLAPAATAAGFVVVAGVLVATRTVAPGVGGERGPIVATSVPVSVNAGSASQAISGFGAIGEPQWQVVDGKLIRDARLDSYLRAHKGVSPVLPGGATGRFESVVLER